MTEEKYSENLPTDEERAAFMGISLAEFKALRHPFEEESERNRADNAARAAAALATPTARLRELARAPIGTSHLFTQYRQPSQLSMLMRTVAEQLDVRFSSRREHSLVDGKVVGVRVMRIG